MAYQALARKWRPRNFQQMVGQEHVLQALINALSHNRLHHAYLFTGTRGVGKTTIARIFAKSLNCETGVTATPCGQCAICQQVDEGSFIDLIEIDAASRTKVEDTRELLDSIRYMPHKGRFKVYVIDEIHMLSNSSFNALLKTLEEPPQHTKFLLATTDPQKIPVTVLSRCLQFHLKHLPAQQVADHLAHILDEEKVTYELPALKQISKAANGSMRDALSLLDQVIAFSNHAVTLEKTNSLLGSIQTVHFYRLMDAICAKNIQQVFAAIAEIGQYTTDFSLILDELLSILHKLAVIQVVPEVVIDFDDPQKLTQWAQQLTAEEIQLFYQIALIGQRDLPLAPSPQIGFEMVLLRMLLFSPNDVEAISTMPSSEEKEQAKKNSNQQAFESNAKIHPPHDTSWLEVLARINLTGITKTLASYCVVKEMTHTHIHLLLDASQAILLNEKQRERLEQALSNFYGVSRKLEISVGNGETLSPAMMQKEQDKQQQQAAFASIQQDQQVQKILQAFDTKLSPEHVKVL